MTVRNHLRDGRKALALRQPARAAQAFQRAEKVSPGDPDVLIPVAALYFAASNKAEGQRWLNKLEPSRLEAPHHAQLAELYYQQDNPKKACEEYERASRAAPIDGMVLNNYVYMCMVEPGKELDRAVPLLERALALAGRKCAIGDSLRWAYYQRAQATKNGADLGRAIDLLSEAVEKQPRVAELRLHLGRAHASAGEWDAAYVELNKALLLAPNLAEARAILAQVNERRSRSRRG
jgi:Tfp pilus assembly protein PilF